MRHIAAFLALTAAACGTSGVASVEEQLVICPPGYARVCEDLGPGGKIICSCECEVQCGSTCPDTLRDTQNCGGCGIVCSTNHVTAACARGVCDGTCATGYADCNNNKQTDGCEISIATDVNNCGGCGVACSTNNITAACSGGVCNGTCAAGFADCNNNKQSDGCETGIASDVNNCGGCGVACSTNNITAACAGGVCNGACAAGYADCNNNKQSDGCETGIASDVNNCGGCGIVCSAWQTCTAGQCVTRQTRTAIILASRPSAPAHPYGNTTNTASIIYSRTNPTSMRSFYYQSSFGAIDIIGSLVNVPGTTADIYGPYIVSTNNCMSDQDVIAAVGNTINWSNYEHVVISANDPNCGGTYTSAATVTLPSGKKTISDSMLFNSALGDTTSNGRIGSIALHEYGHQLGMQHGSGWDCGASSQSLSGCLPWEYDDFTDLMGNANYADFNPVHKEHLGWLNGARITTMPTTATSGSFTLYPYEDGVANLKAVKIPRKLGPSGATGYYYVAFRQPQAPWNDWIAYSPSYAQGVAIYLDEPGFPQASDTALIDTTPDSTQNAFDDPSDGALLVGQTFTDPASQISITLNSLTPNGSAQISVTQAQRTNRYVQAVLYNPGEDPALGSTVQGTGVFAMGSSTSLTAVPPSGWGLSNWWDDAGNGLGLTNPLALQVNADSVVWFALRPAPPSNDNFSAALPVTTLPFTQSQFTGGATVESGEPGTGGTPVACSPSFSTTHTVWFQYQSAGGQNVTIDTNGSDFVTTVGVYTAGGVQGLSLVAGACSYCPGTSYCPGFTFAAAPGTTYYVQMGGSLIGGNLVANFTPGP